MSTTHMIALMPVESMRQPALPIDERRVHRRKHLSVNACSRNE